MKTKDMSTKSLSKEDLKRADLTIGSYEVVRSLTGIFLDTIKTKILLVLIVAMLGNTKISFSEISKLTKISASGVLDNALTTLQKHALIYKEEINSAKLYGLTDAGKITCKFYIVLLRSLLLTLNGNKLPEGLQITTELLNLYIKNTNEISKKLKDIQIPYPVPLR